MAFSKRRIPYSVGGDMLERVKAPPKKFLNPEQDAKLTKDMYALYERLLPSKESEDRRAAFVQKLERILTGQWPEGSIQVHVFGSSGNLLSTSESDGKTLLVYLPVSSAHESRSRHLYHDQEACVGESVLAGQDTCKT